METKYLQVITLNEAFLWDKIVKSFKHYDVYYLSNYVKAFELHGDGVAQLFYYTDEHIQAINVSMKRDIANDPIFEGVIPKNQYFDLATPYGYGGFLIEGNLTDYSLKQLEEEYTQLCKDEKIISEFIRFHPVINNRESVSNIFQIIELGKSVTMNLDTKEMICENLNPKNRNMIRKASRAGIQIYAGRDPKLFQTFQKLYNQTMEQNNARESYYFQDDFYVSLLEDLNSNSRIFYAVYEQKIIAMAIILHCNKQLHYHLAGSLKAYQHLGPNNLLLYEVACWGNEHGYTTFHLGSGLGGREDNLYKFKKVFNRNSNTLFTIGKKIYNDAQYNYLVNLRKQELNFQDDTNFFPLYRS